MSTNCPRCDSADLGSQWVGPGRRLKKYCYKCGWWGEPQVPDQLEIKPTKIVNVRPCGHYYEVFDCYGHILISSRSYSSEKEAEEALNSDLKYGMSDKEAGPYTALLWPSFVEVTAKVFKGF